MSTLFRASRLQPFGPIAFVAAAALLLGIGWTVYSTATSTRRTARQVDATLRMVQAVTSVDQLLSRAEAAQRAFLLYLDEAYVAERDDAFRELRADVERIAAAEDDDPSRKADVARLRQLVVERQAVMASRESERRTARAPLPDTRQGRSVSAAIRDITDRLETRDFARLVEVRDRAEEALGLTIALLIGSVVVCVALVVPGYVAFVRQSRRRDRLERQLVDLTESLPGAVLQYRTRPGSGLGVYEFMSRSAEALRGIDREDALRDPRVVLDTVVPEDRDALLQSLREHGETLTPVRRDFRARTAQGEVRWFRLSAGPRRDSDGSVLWSAHWADVTAEKLMEGELLKAMESADGANRAKSIFLATMSHEIRTPMNGIQGMLELLSLTRLDGEQRTMLEIVRESGRSLSRIIDDILDFSKIEAGKVELQPVAVDVRDVVERVANTYRANASSKGLLLEWRCDADIRPALMVDPGRLQQILNNLVSNAIKFTDRGRVTIEAGLDHRQGDIDTVRFSVSDTGIGMAREDQQRLFEPFTQARADTARLHGGTGLGLSICRRLAGLMGGTIEAESEVGVGTRMVMTLPLRVATEEAMAAAVHAERPFTARAAPTVEEARAAGTLVLVVDDHPVNRIVLQKQLEKAGYASEAAADGLEALDKWAAGRFAAIVTDINMPRMGGYDLARRIRQRERGGPVRTPIIACTANALSGEAESCFASGMDDYVAKPVEIRQLAEKLGQWVPIPYATPARAPSAGAAATAAEEAPIDADVLAELAGGDRALEREIVSRFLEHNGRDARDVERALEALDYGALVLSAHRMKGAARTVGAHGLAAAAETLERAGKAGDAAAVREAMAEVRRELRRVEAHGEAPARDVHG